MKENGIRPVINIELTSEQRLFMTRQLPTCLRARLTLLTRPHLFPLPMLRRVNLFMNDNKYALQMQDITVEFPGVLANDHVSIDCKKARY